MKLRWMYLTYPSEILIPDDDLEYVYGSANPINDSPECMVMGNMIITNSYKEATDETVGYKSMQADNSVFVVLPNVVASDEMTWYLVTTRITRSMQLLSKLHQLKENFDVKYILVRKIFPMEGAQATVTVKTIHTHRVAKV